MGDAHGLWAGFLGGRGKGRRPRRSSYSIDFRPLDALCLMYTVESLGNTMLGVDFYADEGRSSDFGVWI